MSGAALGIAISLSLSVIILAGEDEESEKQWLEYSCEDYSYSIRYPDGYKVIEAKPRRETKSVWSAEVLSEWELHRVTFIEAEYEMWPGLFEISVMPNDDGLGLMDWVEDFINSAEVALSEPDTNDASIFGAGEVSIEGRPAIKLHLFNYDHTGIELFVDYSGVIYNLSFAGSNPSDPNVEEHRAIYIEMLESFAFDE
jgi:hypothetical protein